MSLDTSDIIAAIFQLLPGFVTAWTFFNLTGYRPRSTFERIIHALIMTMLVAAIVALIRPLALGLGRFFVLGMWDDESHHPLSLGVAGILGVVLAAAAHHDIPHKWFRGLDYAADEAPWFWKRIASLKITRNRNEPSEWYGVFAERPARWITLHLSGGRRLYGWPRGWPNVPGRGHFVIEHPAWLLDDGTKAQLYGVKMILIDAVTVEMVEVLNYPKEIEIDEDELKRVETKLVELQEKNDVKETAPGTAAEAAASADPTTCAAASGTDTRR